MKASMHKSLVLFFVLLLAVGLVGAWFVLLPGTARAAVYTVTLTTDTLPVGVPGELRFEINAANATPGVPDTINFAIPGAGPHTISPVAALPNIADQLLINGYTQPGSAPATPVLPATILIELDGTGAGAGVHGLSFTSLANSSRVRGLAINRFNGSGFYIQPNTTLVQIDGNYIGTDAGGTVALANGDRGVHVMDNANNNTIGGTAPANRNIISGNGTNGVYVRNAGGNTVSANYIGTDASGTVAIANVQYGVLFDNGSVGNTIGGNTAGHRNIISGNTQYGVNIHDSHSNNIYGNYIGTDVGGTLALGNSGNGVHLEQGSTTNNIGGNGAGEGNIISGNNSSGVEMPGGGAHCTGNLVRGNNIGVDFTGNVALPNVSHGVYIHSGSNTNTVGGDSTIGEGNLISGNGGDGVRFWFSSTNWVQGNYIGTDAGGANPLPNGNSGVLLWSTSNNNTIGGTIAGHRNIISGNNQSGIRIENSTVNNVQGNYIGTDAAGTAALANGTRGVSITVNSNGNTIGGTTAGHKNIISGNTTQGILIDNSTGNVVEGNYIGTDVNGTAAVSNSQYGVSLWNAANNTIGGTTAGHRNVISGNSNYGVYIDNSTGNDVQGNYIGTQVNGTVALPNTLDGVYIWNNAANNNIGGSNPGEGNVISGNGDDGVDTESISGNTFQGNYIGTDATGTAAVGNGEFGIEVDSSDGNTIGGTITGARNLISGNVSNGVDIDNGTGNVVQGNYIGTDAAGTAALGNGTYGVRIRNGSTANTIGGTAAGEGNLVSGNTVHGVYVNSSTGNSIEGNYIGTDVNGAVAVPNGSVGVFLVNNSNTNTIGGTTTGHRNIISGNTWGGIRVDGSTGNNVQGNYVGTDVTGAVALANVWRGVFLLNNATGNTIGGTTDGHRNVISGNTGDGVFIDGSTGNDVQGNYIGADANGAALGNGSDGVFIDSISNNTTVGGSTAAMNKIAYNGRDGVGIQNSTDCEVSFNYIKSNTRTGVVVWNNTAFRDKISENVIYGNGALGIDLGGDGVTPNDGNNNNPAKPNRGYNFPVFTTGTFPVGAAGAGAGGGGNATVTGTAPPDSIVEIFYTGATPDPSGHGEGIVHLKTVTADGSGNFTADLTGVSGGEHISATATSPAGDPAGEGNTSEFSGNSKLVGANLEVIKAAPGQVEPGAPITYTITIENKGDDAHNVTFTDDIPANTTVVTGTVSCDDPGATVEGEDPVKITGMTIMTGKTVTVTFDVTVDEGTKAGTVIENQAFITYGTTTVLSSDPEHPGEGMPTDVTVAQSKVLGSTSWFIAEGSTGEGFDTWILLQNPGTTQATVDVTFTTDTGPADIVILAMDPETRTTVRVADYVPDTWGVSTIINSTEPIVAERSMYWDSRLEGEGNTPGTPQPFEMRSGHANLGTSGEAIGTSGGGSEGGRTHYFPEGATAGFDTWILLVNPNWLDAQARVVLMTGSGVVLEKDLVVPAMSRATVHLDEYLPDASEVATEVISDIPLVAERSMYWDPDEVNIEAYQMRGGHSNAGSPTAENNWYLAEGSTGGGFETYILLQNPADTEAPVTATFSDATGIANHANLTMPPRTRATLKVSDYVPDNFHISTSVTSDTPIVAERSMYWDKRVVTAAYQMRDGHSTVGVNATGNTWMVPEGSTGAGFDSFVLIANTANTDTDVAVTFMTANGPANPVLITIPANSRYTVRIADYVPDEFQVSTLVSSSGELVVERAMYWDSRETYPLHSYDIRPYEMMGGHSASGLDP